MVDAKELDPQVVDHVFGLCSAAASQTGAIFQNLEMETLRLTPDEARIDVRLKFASFISKCTELRRSFGGGRSVANRTEAARSVLMLGDQVKSYIGLSSGTSATSEDSLVSIAFHGIDVQQDSINESLEMLERLTGEMSQPKGDDAVDVDETSRIQEVSPEGSMPGSSGDATTRIFPNADQQATAAQHITDVLKVLQMEVREEHLDTSTQALLRDFAIPRLELSLEHILAPPLPDQQVQFRRTSLYERLENIDLVFRVLRNAGAAAVAFTAVYAMLSGFWEPLLGMIRTLGLPDGP